MSEIKNHAEQINSKPIKLTKKGLPDKRAESSKKNLEKGKSIIKQALQKIKEAPKQESKSKLDIVYSSDEYSTDEEEIILTEVNVNKGDPKIIKIDDQREELKKQKSVVLPKIERKETENTHSENYTFTFEKKFEEYNNKINSLEQETKLTKEELKLIKEQNQALKKSMTSGFRTHAGIMNQEMYLKF